MFMSLVASNLALATNVTGPSRVFVALAAFMMEGPLTVLRLMGVFSDGMARFLPGCLEESYHRFE